MAGFDGFYLTRGHHSNNASANLHQIELLDLHTVPSMVKIPTGKVHHLVLRLTLCTCMYIYTYLYTNICACCNYILRNSPLAFLLIEGL